MCGREVGNVCERKRDEERNRHRQSVHEPMLMHILQCKCFLYSIEFCNWVNRLDLAVLNHSNNNNNNNIRLYATGLFFISINVL